MYNLARISKVLLFYSIVHSCRNIVETCLAKIIEMPGIHSKRHANSKHAICIECYTYIPEQRKN